MIKTNIELAALALKVAMSFITMYVRGCFGAPMTESNKQRYINAQEFNRRADRLPKIRAATGKTFGFDCVCFIKALLWGWVGDLSHEYGGAEYESNGVPDKNADEMIKQCKEVSDDFSKIRVGEMVWISGHCGIYIGNCQVAECTYRWNDGVQITRVHNLVPDDGTPGRKWEKHGKLPWISYVEETAAEPQDKSQKETETGITLRTLRNGDKGEDVRAMQILLAGNDCNGQMKASAYGSFGGKTADAVKMFQKKVGLPQTGICDQETWRKLLGVRA